MRAPRRQHFARRLLTGLVALLAVGLFLGASVAGASAGRPSQLAPVRQAAPPKPLAKDRSVTGIVQEVRPDGLTLRNGQGREVTIALAPGAVVKLGTSQVELGALRPNDRVTAVGRSRAGTLIAQIVTVKRANPRGNRPA